MISSKVRRHSGRITPRFSERSMKKADLLWLALEPQVYWDDWQDYRDGMRGSDDHKSLRNRFMRSGDYLNVEKWNARLRKLILLRKRKKAVRKFK